MACSGTDLAFIINVNKLGGLGMYLYRMRCRWEKERNHGEREWRTMVYSQCSKS
jgi:hypothetical protein